ncbi:hypothetical protein CLOP_g21716 [Closterium sp. NIES-67]|nr:hypothetical protein CLOP_g21716 [Closterium sp. NIES-67]
MRDTRCFCAKELYSQRIELDPRAQPTVRSQWRLSQPELMELRTQLDYLLEKKFIHPYTSPYAAPILFTPKKDGGLQMCTDYRVLNKITIKPRYLIPRADDLIDQLRGARIFSKTDLRGGYHQIRIAEADISKTVFRTRYGSYEYIVMPFGLTNAPSTFQLTMNEVFCSLLDKCAIVYLDDILVYSISREQHLRSYNFLGHIISIEGVKIDPRKISTIRNWEPSTNVERLQSVLGFVNYMRRLIPKMAESTAPLTDLLRKAVFYEWGERQQAAFDQLKTFLITPPVLHIADPDRLYKLVTDASDIAVGVVLL